MRRRASFFIGAIVGWVACVLSGALLNGCADPGLEGIMGGMCHYGAGVARIELTDPTGVYSTHYGQASIGSDTVSRCEQSARLTDGSELTISCRGNPVNFCDAHGICRDGASGDYFECEGKAVFE